MEYKLWLLLSRWLFTNTPRFLLINADAKHLAVFQLQRYKQPFARVYLFLPAAARAEANSLAVGASPA